jgi:hypothetical protein
MPEYLAPGVFIEEIECGQRPIEGVATSTAAFLGETERGPTRPTLVTSFNEYHRQFGGAFGSDKFLPYAVSGFFENGGDRTYICRLTSNGAQVAGIQLGGIDFVASGPGEWGNRVFIKLEDASSTTLLNGPVTRFRLQIAYWDTPAPGGAYPDPFDPEQTMNPPRPAYVEDFDELEFKDNASIDYYGKRLKNGSILIRLTPDGPRRSPRLRRRRLLSSAAVRTARRCKSTIFWGPTSTARGARGWRRWSSTSTEKSRWSPCLAFQTSRSARLSMNTVKKTASASRCSILRPRKAMPAASTRAPT